MALPSDERIQGELMDLLSCAPDAQMHCREIYQELAERFPELTPDEVSVPYGTSVSHFANRVQFARLHLVVQGLLLRPAAGDGRGWWTLSSKGRKEHAEQAALGERLLADLEALSLMSEPGVLDEETHVNAGANSGC